MLLICRKNCDSDGQNVFALRTEKFIMAVAVVTDLTSIPDNLASFQLIATDPIPIFDRQSGAGIFDCTFFRTIELKSRR